MKGKIPELISDVEKLNDLEFRKKWGIDKRSVKIVNKNGTFEIGSNMLNILLGNSIICSNSGCKVTADRLVGWVPASVSHRAFRDLIGDLDEVIYKNQELSEKISLLEFRVITPYEIHFKVNGCPVNLYLISSDTMEGFVVFGDEVYYVTVPKKTLREFLEDVASGVIPENNVIATIKARVETARVIGRNHYIFKRGKITMWVEDDHVVYNAPGVSKEVIDNDWTSHVEAAFR